MFTVTPSNVESILPEITQGGYDVIGTVTLLTLVMQCQDQLEQQHDPQLCDRLVDELLSALEWQTRELRCLVGFVRRHCTDCTG